MKWNRGHTATLGLLFITVWSALQYILLPGLPESVSTFAFLCVTNTVGLLILVPLRLKKLHTLSRKTMKKGLLLAAEIMGFNFFMIVGARGMAPVAVSSLSALYFVFVPLILLAMRRRVSFRSAVATVVAVIAMLLILNVGPEVFFQSSGVLLMIVSDVFIALNIITVSIVGKDEDPGLLTFAQLVSAAGLSLAAWTAEVLLGRSSYSLPADGTFWFTVLFMGVFIRVLYSIVQMACQKYVKPINASLIFSSEIIITLLITPLFAILLHTEYTPATGFQIIGCVLFMVAILVADDTIMSRFGYSDMEVRTYTDENGVTRTQSTVSRKLTNLTLVISTAILVVSTVICLSSISNIRTTAVQENQNLGQTASAASEVALKAELETELTNTVTDKAMLADAKLRGYIASARYAADLIVSFYEEPDGFPDREIQLPKPEDVGQWTMQRVLADESISYESQRAESRLLGNLESIFQSIIAQNPDVATVYFGTENGLLVSYDPNAMVEEDGGETYYEYRQTEWYAGGRTVKEPFFTKAYQDGTGEVTGNALGLTITCVAPVRDGEGALLGCVGIDIRIGDLNESMVNDNIVDPNYATLIDAEGSVIASKNVSRETSGTLTIYDHPSSEPIRAVAVEVLSGRDGLEISGEGDGTVYIAHARIPLTDWTLCVMSPVADIIRPAVEIRESIDDNTRVVADTISAGIRTIVSSCLALFALIILVITYFVGKSAEKITTPLQQLEQDVLEISGGNLDRRTQVSTDDEIGSLARSFNAMTSSLQQYITNLKEVTAKEERIASELSVATAIQANMLPRNFDQLDRGEFDIYATMTPAKEVGGDFYDFFLVDDDHLAMVMADVSGKGVPAALFMMISKTLLKSAAQQGLSPKAVLEKVNNQLCENNDAEMFVTVWLGILEISTGKMTCANAGHEYPAIKRAGGEFKLFKDKHGFVLAGMEGARYREYELELHPGDMLYVYTDGVAEATDAQNELYGTGRMLSALNRLKDQPCDAMLYGVKADIDAFVGDAPQFDDITMLCLKLNGAGQDETGLHLKVKPVLEELETVTASLEQFLEDAEVPVKNVTQINIAVDEIFSNIARYSGASAAEIRCDVQDGRITLVFTDDGSPYDPTQTPDPDTTLSVEERDIGGLGIYMVKKSMDSVTYEQQDGKNVLTLTKGF